MGCCGKAGQIVEGYSTLIVDKIKKKDTHSFTQERIKTCKQNQGKCSTRNGTWCKICLCYIEAKTRVKEKICPLGKWKD